MTMAIVSGAIGASVRDVARLPLEKRVSAVPALLGAGSECRFGRQPTELSDDGKVTLRGRSTPRRPDSGTPARGGPANRARIDHFVLASSVGKDRLKSSTRRRHPPVGVAHRKGQEILAFHRNGAVFLRLRQPLLNRQRSPADHLARHTRLGGHHLPILPRIGRGDAFAGCGISDIRASVPFEPPGIGGVVELAGRRTQARNLLRQASAARRLARQKLNRKIVAFR